VEENSGDKIEIHENTDLEEKDEEIVTAYLLFLRSLPTLQFHRDLEKW